MLSPGLAASHAMSGDLPHIPHLARHPSLPLMQSTLALPAFQRTFFPTIGSTCNPDITFPNVAINMYHALQLHVDVGPHVPVSCTTTLGLPLQICFSLLESGTSASEQPACGKPLSSHHVRPQTCTIQISETFGNIISTQGNASDPNEARVLVTMVGTSQRPPLTLVSTTLGLPRKQFRRGQQDSTC